MSAYDKDPQWTGNRHALLTNDATHNAEAIFQIIPIPDKQFVQNVGRIYKHSIKLNTPTSYGRGIHKYYMLAVQHDGDKYLGWQQSQSQKLQGSGPQHAPVTQHRIRKYNRSADKIVPKIIANEIPATAPGSSHILYELVVVVVVGVVVVISLNKTSTVYDDDNCGVPLSFAVTVSVYNVP